jgi:hypothetical protein
MYSEILLSLELHRIGHTCVVSYSDITVAAVDNYWRMSVTACDLCFVLPILILVFFYLMITHKI